MRAILVALLLVAGATGACAQTETALAERAATALQARDWPAAESTFRQLATAAPTNWTYLQGLADALGGQNKYPEAITTYDKAIPLALAAKDDKARAAAGAMLTSEGLIYLRQKKLAESVAPLTKATEYVPNQGTAWFNVCAAAYNAGNMAAARAGCDKAIAADPNKADAWFIKGSILFADSSTGPGGKIVPPKGTIEALQKYLALAPNGPHVNDVKEMLAAVK